MNKTGAPLGQEPVTSSELLWRNAVTQTAENAQQRNKLLEAVKKGNLCLVQELWEEQKNSKKGVVTPLHQAAGYGKPDIANFLLDQVFSS